MGKESFSEKLEKWGDEHIKATGSEGCVTLTAQYILMVFAWFIVSWFVIVLADWMGFILSSDMGRG